MSPPSALHPACQNPHVGLSIKKSTNKGLTQATNIPGTQLSQLCGPVCQRHAAVRCLGVKCCFGGGGSGGIGSHLLSHIDSEPTGSQRPERNQTTIRLSPIQSVR